MREAGSYSQALVALVLISVVSLGLYTVLWAIDCGAGGPAPWSLFLEPGAANTLTSFSEVTVADIIVAVDEPIDATQCAGKENCHDDQKCLTHDLWMRLNDQIFEFLRSVTLGQLVEQHRAKQANVVELRDQRVGKRSQTEAVAA